MKTNTLYPEHIARAIKRADVHVHRDIMTMTLHLVSGNFDEPLTEEEKQDILTHFTIHNFPMYVVFDN